MKKLVIVINGSGGAGKDTLCDMAAKHFETVNVSSIDPIKRIARENGWNGEKDLKSRKFLADLKQLFTEYNDLPTKYIIEKYKEFLCRVISCLLVLIYYFEEGDYESAADIFYLFCISLFYSLHFVLYLYAILPRRAFV